MGETQVAWADASPNPVVAARALRRNRGAAQLAALTVVGLVVSSFGPYLAGPVRLEQLFVYGSAIVWTLASVGRLTGTPAWSVTVSLWALFVVAALTATLSSPAMPEGVVPRGFLAGLDNYLLPLAVLFLTLALRRVLSFESMVRLIFRTLLVLLLFNTLAALAQMALGVRFGMFWSSQEGASVAELALGNSRYSGIFNQPAEAGLAYGFGLIGLTLLPLFRARDVALFLPFILLGGALPGSKVFLAALGLVLLALAITHGSYRVVTRRATFAVMALGGVLVALAAPAVVLATAERLAGSAGLLSSVTAGRLGAGGTNSEALQVVFGGPWLFGYGVGGIAPIPYDSAVVEVAVTGGVLGLCVMTLVWIVIARSFLAASGRWRPFGLVFLALIAVASLGFSPLTANRVSSVAWIVIAAFLLQRSSDWPAQVLRTRVWSPSDSGPSPRRQGPAPGFTDEESLVDGATAGDSGRPS